MASASKLESLAEALGDARAVVDAPLAGVSVLEIGTFATAPYCTSLLADMGATVVKVEAPRVGDGARYEGPFPDGRLDSEHSGLFAYVNKGKRSVTLDLETPTGADLLQQLATRADIVVENVRDDLRNTAALDYARLSADNPSLVMASISAYGAQGPWSGQHAFNIQLMAASGFSATVGMPDREPRELPGRVAEMNAGLDAAAAVLTMLLAAQKPGEGGTLLDLAALDNLSALHTGADLIDNYFGVPAPRRFGNRQAGGAGLSFTLNLPAADGYAYVYSGMRGQLAALLETAAGDMGVDEIPERSETEKIESLLTDWLPTKTRAEVLELELERSIGALPVRTAQEAIDDHEPRERRTVELPGGDQLSMPASAMAFENDAWQGETARNGRVPRLGEANLEVLGDVLGVPREDLTVMFQTGVI